MSNPRPLVDERGLAATYDGGAYVDAWDAVEQYRKATSYAFRKGVKSSATARALDLPRGRLRTWIDDGGQPDAVRGIEVAREHGWLDLEYDDPEFAALNVLVANVYSGGSIAEQHYQPSFALNHLDHKSHVVDALEAAGVEYDFYHEEDEDRSTEVRPTEHGTVLGRVLSVLGAPVGPKAAIQNLKLPEYLDDAPREIRETFALAYLANRAIHQREKRTVQILEDRPRSYRNELAAFLEDVSGERVTSNETYITISSAAAQSLNLQPRYFVPEPDS